MVDVVGVGFSIYDLTNGDPTQQKIDELSSKIYALEASIDQLGVTLMQELEVVQALIPTVAINTAVADARAARGELLRLQAVEDPSEQQRLDTIASAEQALLRVLGQAGTILNGQNPESAIGLFGALAYAVTVRLEVAHALEDGAMGAQVLRGSLADTAGALRRIAQEIPGQIHDAIETRTTTSQRAEGGLIVVRFVTTAFSPFSEAQEVNTVEKGFGPFQLIAGIQAELDFRINTLEPRMRDRLAEAEAELLPLAEIATAADQLDALADGTQRTGTPDRDTLTGTDGNDLLIGLGATTCWTAARMATCCMVAAGTMRCRVRAVMTCWTVVRARTRSPRAPAMTLIDGGAGDDLLNGGVGFDSIDAGVGDDSAFGLNGFDTIHGNAGNDTLSGNAGNDLLYGGGDADRLEGGIGFDTLNGDAGNDVIFAGNGFDLLFGGAGVDRLEGNAGNDTLDGGAGADVLKGGIGADTFVFGVGSDHDRIADVQAVDTVQIAAGLLDGSTDLADFASQNADGFLMHQHPELW
ncbi:calcium-binding protein [Rhodophyticola sp.]|uniref:calcium-binding protein n=1 Tax=Rhodophyticola sp. TaxID=2680032 RepID=UPI003D26745D